MKLNQYLSDAIAASPAAAAAASAGNPTDGDPANNVEATAPGAYWFYQLQQEIAAVLADGGQTPALSDLTQLRDAIRARIAADIAAISFPTGVTLATQNEHTQANPVTGEAAVPAYVKVMIDNAINDLVGGAPGALDTLNELADALGDDASYHTTITNMLALKAPLAGPVFTGDPRAPTPSAADDDTSIATTAWVRNRTTLVPTELLYSADGQPITADNAGTAVSIASGLSNYRYIDVSWARRKSTADEVFFGRANVAALPSAFSTVPTFELHGAGSIDLQLWVPSDTELRARGKDVSGVIIYSIVGLAVS